MDTTKGLQKKLTAVAAVADARKAELEESLDRIASIDAEIKNFEKLEDATDKELLKAAGKASVWTDTIAAYKKMRALNVTDRDALATAYGAAVELQSTIADQLKSYVEGKKKLDTDLKAKKITSDGYKKGKEALKKELAIK